jgi:hypothetical protein
MSSQPSGGASTDTTFVPSLACVLSHLVSINDSNSPTFGESPPVTVFHAVRIPSVSIHDYLNRIAKYFWCSPECFVMSLIYIDRIMKRRPDFVVCKLNIHRLVITAMMLAVKFYDDIYYSNAYYAKVGGVKSNEMNILEIQFLKLIEWHLFISNEEFELYKRNVQIAVSGGTPSRQQSGILSFDDEGCGDDIRTPPQSHKPIINSNY